MTDHLTEAVRRLRQLQEDVERLKSGGDQGEVRELRRVDETTDCDDDVEVGADASVDETTEASETATTTTTTATDIAEYDQNNYDDGSTYG